MKNQGPEETITKVSRIIQRADGSEVRITAQAMFGEGLTRSIDTYVHRRESPNHEWRLCSNRPHPDWKAMSVDDYVKHGRSEVLQVVSHAEILAVSQAIGTSRADAEGRYILPAEEESSQSEEIEDSPAPGA